MKSFTLILPACLSFAAGSVQAATLAEYTFNSNSTLSTDGDTSTDASALTTSANGTNASGFGVIATPSGASDPAVTWAANAENSAADSYFEFTLALGPNTTDMSFEALSFDALVFDTLANTTAFDYQLFWSVAGFATAIGTETGPSISGGGAQNDSAGISFDLSTLATQTTDVTFRLDPIFAAGSATNGGGSQRGGALDNLTLTGSTTVATTAPIPLPASTGLLLTAMGGFALIRRKQAARRNG